MDNKNHVLVEGSEVKVNRIVGLKDFRQSRSTKIRVKQRQDGTNNGIFHTTHQTVSHNPLHYLKVSVPCKTPSPTGNSSYQIQNYHLSSEPADNLFASNLPPVCLLRTWRTFVWLDPVEHFSSNLLYFCLFPTLTKILELKLIAQEVELNKYRRQSRISFDKKTDKYGIWVLPS